MRVGKCLGVCLYAYQLLYLHLPSEPDIFRQEDFVVCLQQHCGESMGPNVSNWMVTSGVFLIGCYQGGALSSLICQTSDG